MNRIQLSFNKQEFNQRMEMFYSLRKELTQILDAYNTMQLAPIADRAEFVEMVKDVCKFVVSRIANGAELAIGNIQIRRDKAFEFLEKPAGYDSLYQLAGKFNSVRNNLLYLKHFDFIEGKVVITDSFVKSIEAQCSMYAENEAELKMLEFANGIQALCKKLFGKDNTPIADLPNLFYCDVNTNEWKVSAFGVKNNLFVRNFNYKHTEDF